MKENKVDNYVDNLQSILYKKYNEKNLASLYIAKYDSESIDPDLWVNKFLSQFTTIEDHPDVLKIYKNEKENEYKVDSPSIKNFLKFINYRSLKLEKKFVFLFDAQDLSVILANKLLKVFEELSSDICMILMVPDNALLLPTVESRAIKLQIPKSKTAGLEADDAFDFSTIKTPMDLLSYLKQTSENPALVEKKFIESAIERILKNSKPDVETYNLLEALQKVLKDYETQSAFNNSKLARLTPFFP